MSTEQLQTEGEAATRRAAWEACRFTIGGDRARFEASYVGTFATRAAFGEHLLREDRAAERHLARLPRWLVDYVRLDGEKCASDMERDGHFRFISGEEGVFVFEQLWVPDE